MTNVHEYIIVERESDGLTINTEGPVIEGLKVIVRDGAPLNIGGEDAYARLRSCDFSFEGVIDATRETMMARLQAGGNRVMKVVTPFPENVLPEQLEATYDIYRTPAIAPEPTPPPVHEIPVPKATAPAIEPEAPPRLVTPEVTRAVLDVALANTSELPRPILTPRNAWEKSAPDGTIQLYGNGFPRKGSAISRSDILMPYSNIKPLTRGSSLRIKNFTRGDYSDNSRIFVEAVTWGESTGRGDIKIRIDSGATLRIKSINCDSEGSRDKAGIHITVGAGATLQIDNLNELRGCVITLGAGARLLPTERITDDVRRLNQIIQGESPEGPPAPAEATALGRIEPGLVIITPPPADSAALLEEGMLLIAPIATTQPAPLKRTRKQPPPPPAISQHEIQIPQVPGRKTLTDRAALTRTDMRTPEIFRDYEIKIVGDLHGRLEAYRENLRYLEVVDENGDWKGENKKIVFLGDIIADRGTEGLEILMAIKKLQEQARQAGGGEVVVLAGNHEDFAISYLMGKDVASGGDASHNCSLGREVGKEQGKGLIELLQYGKETLKKRAEKEGLMALVLAISQASAEVLRNMQNHPKGKEILAAITGMKLAEKIDDTLFVHTPPTPGMISALKAKGIAGVNRIFQEGLRAGLLEGKTASAEFMQLCDIFLNTGSREAFSNAETAGILKGMGIKAIAFGHEDANRSFNNGVVEIHGIRLIPTDRSAFKEGTDNQRRSVATIRQDGSVLYGEEDKLIREALDLEPPPPPPLPTMPAGTMQTGLHQRPVVPFVMPEGWVSPFPSYVGADPAQIRIGMVRAAQAGKEIDVTSNSAITGFEGEPPALIRVKRGANMGIDDKGKGVALTVEVADVSRQYVFVRGKGAGKNIKIRCKGQETDYQVYREVFDQPTGRRKITNSQEGVNYCDGGTVGEPVIMNLKDASGLKMVIKSGAHWHIKGHHEKTTYYVESGANVTMDDSEDCTFYTVKGAKVILKKGKTYSGKVAHGTVKDENGENKEGFMEASDSEILGHFPQSKKVQAPAVSAKSVEEQLRDGINKNRRI